MKALVVFLALSLLGLPAFAGGHAQECDGTFHFVENFGAGRFTGLNEIDALSSIEAWAVGSYRSGDGSHVLIVRWDGLAWKRISPPEVKRGELVLTDVDVLGSNDVWFRATEATA